MGLQEFLKVKKFTYKQYLAYLKQKYGKVLYRYGNKKNHKKGLFIHHDKEDEIPSLSHSDNRKAFPEYQAPEFLTYCDYLEHLLLHIMIGREANPELNLGLNGPCKYILPAIINYYKEGIRNTKWDPEYYTALDGKKDIFDNLLVEYNELVKNLDIVATENKVLCLEAEEMLATKGRALIILGMGLGKTDTSAQIFKDWNCRVLVIGPNNVIKGNWKEKFGDWVDTITYMGFAYHYQEIDYSQYGFVILDEVHHAGYSEELNAGAKIWGKAIKYLADNNIKILGLTATPDRADGIMLGETLFKDCTCRGRTIDEAIKLNHIHKFSYITSIYDTDGLTKELKELGWHNTTDDPERIKLEGQLDIALNNIPTVSNLLINRMPKNKRKGYIFVSSADQVQEAIDIFHKAFPNEEVREFHNKVDKKENKETLKWFKETDHGFLVAINMINEGAHYKGVNTIIMFRKTESYVLYSQQIGRLIVPVKYDNPDGIVFDLVNNINSIKYNDRVKDQNKPSLPRDLQKALAESREKLSGQIIVEDYCQDFVKRYEALRNYLDNSWEDWEIEIVKQYYALEGPEGCQKRIDAEWERRHPGSLTYEAL